MDDGTVLDHRSFIRFAASFEAALALAAVGIGYAAEVPPPSLDPGWRTIAVGLAATVPLVLFYLIAVRLPFAPIKRISDLLLSTLGRPLSECRWHELALLAALAGVCEELLFRGVLQPWFGQYGPWVAWLGTNLLFGIAHAVTPTYFVLAAVMGLYFSAVQKGAGDHLLAPMIAHALYDWFAFVQVAREYRRKSGTSPEEQVDDEG